MGKRIFSCTNPSGIRPDASKTSGLSPTEGICAGMTAVWCLKMGIGLPPLSTCPGQAESTHLQFAYDSHNFNAGTVIKSFLPMARLAVFEGTVWDTTGKGGVGAIVREGEGRTYFWGYPGHAIGAARRDGKYYVFNPDVGLDELANSNEFRTHMVENYPQLPDPHWWLFGVMPDPKQLANVVPPKRA